MKSRASASGGVTFRIALTAVFSMTLLGVTHVYAQGEDFILPQTAVVEREVNLRTDPSTKEPPIAVLKPTERVRLLEIDKSAGFYHVMTAGEQSGWVWARNVRLLPAELFLKETLGVAVAAPAPRRPPHCVVEDAANCPEIGCAEDGSEHALLNETKRRRPTGSGTTLTFEDFEELQRLATPLIGQKGPLTRAQRNRIRRLNAPSGTVGEGDKVRIAGFIVGDPHHNSSGESVNCHLPRVANNDLHITLARRPGPKSLEFQGIVVEMIPQDRPAEWGVSRLNKARNQGKLVLAVGQLFYDNEHWVNKNPRKNKGGQPKRFSLWEVHPVTEFYVCNRGDNQCDPDRPGKNGGWVSLKDF